MQSYLYYYMFWILAPVLLSFVVKHPAALALAVVALVARRWFPDPVTWLATAQQIGGLRGQLRLNPGNNKARRDLAWLYMRRRKPKLAAETLRPALEREPESQELRLMLGRAALGSGDFAAALAAVAPIGERDPKFRYGEAFAVQARALAKLDRDAEAEAAWQALVKVNSSSVEAWYELAKSRGARRDPDGKRQALEEAVKTFESLPSFQRKAQWGAFARSRLALLVG